MTFNEQELQIIRHGKEQGKSRVEVESALRRYRTGQSMQKPVNEELSEYRQTPEYTSRFQETKEDILETGTALKERGIRGAERFGEIDRARQEGEIGRAESFLTKAGTALGAGAGAIGDVFMGALKTLAPQKVEEKTAETVEKAVKPVMETETAQRLMQDYQSLEPKEKRRVDAALGGLSALTEALGFGVGGRGAKAVTETIKEATTKATKAIDEAVRTTTPKVVSKFKDTDLPVIGAKQSTEELEDKALKAAAELLQSGSKKSAKGRAAQFNNADIQAMQAIRDTIRPINSQQELADFFDDAIGVLTKNRDDILKPLLNNPVDDSYQNILKAEVRALQKAKDVKTANVYAKLWKREKDIFDSLGKNAKGGKNTVAHLNERIKAINKEVNKLYNEVGGKENLLPDQKIEVQAYELLRQGLKKELDKVGGEIYAELGKRSSGLQSAREFARIQRDRAKNALTDTPWETMTAKERALFVKEFFPTIKDFGVKALVKLDTKADVLDGLVEAKVRQIRHFGQKAIQETPE